MKTKWLAIGIILLFVGTCIIPAIAQDAEKPLPTSRGNWLYVGGSGPGNYTRIQDAIDNSSDGDTVFVYDDSSPYVENIGIDKSIQLLGEDKNTTIIDGTQKGHTIVLKANNSTIQGFTIKNGTSYGVLLLCSDSNIFSNILTSNSVGIKEIQGETHNTIRYNFISENSIGIEVDWNHYDSIICHNTFIRNGGGLRLDGKNNIIEYNVFINNSEYGLFLNNYNVITHNDFFNNGVYPWAIYRQSIFENNTVNGKPLIFLIEKIGIEIEDAGQILLYRCGSIHIKNLDLSSTSVGLTLYEVNGLTVENCRLNNNNVGLIIIDSNNIMISKNSFSNNQEGIEIYPSTSLKIQNNNFINNSKIIVFELDYRQIRNTLLNNFYEGKITKFPKFLPGRVKTRFTQINPVTQREEPIYRLGFLIDRNPRLLPNSNLFLKT